MGFADELATYRGFLMSVGTRMTGNPDDAEDLVHDTMVRALEHRGSFTPGTDMRAWLARIMKNHFLNGRGRDRVRRRLAESPVAEDVSVLWTGRVPGPEEEAVRSRVRRAVAALPDPYGEAVSQVDLRGLRYREAAEASGVPIGTVMSRLHRGRRSLAQALDEAA
jgi:RNA polymerase sigma-70 factor (ECF subfamily)